MEIGFVLILSFFGLILANIPIAVALGLSTILTMILFGLPLDMYPAMMFSGISKFTLLAIPFFVLAGLVMERAGISRRIIRLVELVVGEVPGGLAIATVIVSLFWGAVSGSGPATVAALGAILIPAMIKAGYDKGFASALMAASGGVAIIIPPSIVFIVYGIVAGVSIGKIFIAGIIPGFIVGLGFIAVVLITSIRKGYRGERFGTLREIWAAFKDAFWGLLSPVIILGGIYGGIFTPTEAAGVAVIYGLVVGLFIYREFRWDGVIKLLADSAISSAVVMIIISNATVFSWLITSQGVANAISGSLLEFTTNQMLMLVIINIVVLIAGCLIDGISIIYIFMPILLPIIKVFNLDPVWFGIVLTVNIAIGQITPPVAVNLYPACTIGNVTLSRISKAIIPFVISAVVVLIIITYFPALSTWLPNALGMK